MNYYRLLSRNFIPIYQALLIDINYNMSYIQRISFVFAFSLIIIWIKIIRIMLYLMKVRYLRQRLYPLLNERNMMQHILKYDLFYRYLFYGLFGLFFFADIIMINSISNYPWNICICLIVLPRVVTGLEFSDRSG